MARDNRSGASPPGDSEPKAAGQKPIDPDVAMFAARTFERQAAERQAKQAQRDARRRDEEHQALVASKDAAAAEVKRLRTVERADPHEAEAAEATYRKALADLISFETGSAPAWAPPPATEPEATEPEATEPAAATDAGGGTESAEGEAGADVDGVADEA
ncbi:MAG: hypothetical protein M3Z46_08180 [Actinomycetota bacterium]|nr:hypothetical protein [Actinomycetota bacterium]